MRNFEKDFDLNVIEDGTVCLPMKGFREDVYPAMVFDSLKNRLNDTERQARILAMTKRAAEEAKKGNI